MSTEHASPHVASRREGGKAVAGLPRAASDRPLVSILMFCRNAESCLQRALDSACAQTYPNTEIIVVDGNSDDGTVDILQRNDAAIDYWLSEPDTCASDGQNKTLSLMNGEYFFFINADDWIDPDYIDICMTVMAEKAVDFVFGNTQMYRDGIWDKTSYGCKNFEKTMYKYHSIPTITVFYHRRFYDICGPVDCSYATASDYEWFLRALSKGLKGRHDARITAHMTSGGRSAPENWKTGLKVALHPEGHEIRIAYGVHPLRAYLAHFEDVARYVLSRILISLGLARVRNLIPQALRR